VNFIIFSAIVYYLVADKLKDFLSSRTQGIRDRLDEAQKIVQKSKSQLENAKEKVEQSKVLASEIIQSATNEVKTIEKRIEQNAKTEIKHIETMFQNKMEIGLKKAKSKATHEVLQELLSDENIDFNQDKLVDIVLKKVA
jgi:F-type H+-transporting ATPase subunit b